MLGKKRQVPDATVFEGPIGSTRTDAVKVPSGAGMTSLKVYRSINAQTDPGLLVDALAGTINTHNDQALAVPYLLHDPERRKFVLVLHPSVAHRLLDEVSRVYAALADAPVSGLPSYVLRFDVAVGHEELARVLQSEQDEVPGTSKEGTERIRGQEAHLANREYRLEQRQRELTRREAELNELAAQVDARLASLGAREHEQSRALERLREQELALSVRSIAPGAFTDFPAPRVAIRLTNVDELSQSVEEVVDDEDLEEVSETDGVTIASDEVSLTSAEYVTESTVATAAPQMTGSTRPSQPPQSTRPSSAPLPFRKTEWTAKSAVEAAQYLEALAPLLTQAGARRSGVDLARDKMEAEQGFAVALREGERFGLLEREDFYARAGGAPNGTVADGSTRVLRVAARFLTLTRDEKAGGLDPTAVVENWQRIISEARRVEVTLPGEILEAAWSTLHPNGPLALATRPVSLRSMNTITLLELLEHPRLRVDAARELCTRKEQASAEAVVLAMRTMSADEVLTLAPELAGLGESVGDILIDGLTAKGPYARLASALVLGELKLRRAVVPLAHALLQEPTEAWRELARILGEFGAAGLRGFSKNIKEPEGSEDRLILALAHAAVCGAAKQVEEVSKDPAPAAAKIGLRALTMRDVARNHGRAVRSSTEPTIQDTYARFSWSFWKRVTEQSTSTENTV